MDTNVALFCFSLLAYRSIHCVLVTPFTSLPFPVWPTCFCALLLSSIFLYLR